MRTTRHILLFSSLLLLFLSACKKGDKAPPDNAQPSFPLNTEWTGTMHLTGQQFDQPCCLQIRSDNTVAIYSYFGFFINNDVVYKDSIFCDLVSIDSADGNVNVEVTFPDYPNISGTGTLIIKEHHQLQYVGPNSNFALYLEPFSNKGISVEGRWAGPIMHGRYEGRPAYPDLLDIVFNADSTTTYWRGGTLAYHGVQQSGDYYLITVPYIEKVPMVRMSGYNEMNQKLIGYFGVFIGRGDTMLVTSRDFANGRLPSKINGSYQEGPYGTSGYTPYIIRE